MLNILLILRSVCDVIVVVNMVIVNEKPTNLMMLIKHIKLFLPFLMDLFLLLILVVINRTYVRHAIVSLNDDT